LKKKSVTEVEEQGRWEYFFEQDSWVSKQGLQVKKRSLERGGGPKKSVTELL
jgi:hypothetical protein